MPKGYVIARADIKDADAYAKYAALAGEAIRAHGGRPLVRGGKHEALEGPARQRNVVLEFENFEQARAYYHSAQYQAAKAMREGAAEMEIVCVEGT
jgi:uncharacterized protein (DUF1330 family)